jgi:hypothetical protein
MMTTKLTYTGTASGNSQATSTGGANTLTPVIMTNGLSYSCIERLNIGISVSGSVGIYLYQDGTKGQTNQNSFKDILFESATNGVCIGFQSNALCSENTFINCSAIGCSTGFVNIASNALNNRFYNCSAASCTLGFTAATGSIYLDGGSFANNATCDIQTGEYPMTVIGARTESVNFIDATGNSNPTHYVAGCFHATQGVTGYFINLGSGSRAVLDACYQQSAVATAGKVSGTASAKVYLRGCKFENASFLTAFTGTVGQNI